jgi:hypothetical protein
MIQAHSALAKQANAPGTGQHFHFCATSRWEPGRAAIRPLSGPYGADQFRPGYHTATYKTPFYAYITFLDFRFYTHATLMLHFTVFGRNQIRNNPLLNDIKQKS